MPVAAVTTTPTHRVQFREPDSSAFFYTKEETEKQEMWQGEVKKVKS